MKKILLPIVLLLCMAAGSAPRTASIIPKTFVSNGTRYNGFELRATSAKPPANLKGWWTKEYLVTVYRNKKYMGFAYMNSGSRLYGFPSGTYSLRVYAVFTNGTNQGTTSDYIELPFTVR